MLWFGLGDSRKLKSVHLFTKYPPQQKGRSIEVVGDDVAPMV
jgi:hypothetical protein